MRPSMAAKLGHQWRRGSYSQKGQRERERESGQRKAARRGLVNGEGDYCDAGENTTQRG